MGNSTFFYDSIANYYDHIFPLNQAQVSFCDWLSNGLSDKKILDVGCGTGSLAIALAELGADVTAIDPDSKMIQCAGCKNETTSVSFHANALESTDLQTNSYNTAVCFGNTIAHLPESGLNDFFEKMHSLLKQDGSLAIQLLNYNHILSNKVSELPEIDNKYIRFERSYSFSNLPETIEFKTRLLIKSKYQYIDNSIPLYPHRKERIIACMEQTGFKDIRSYGNFKKDEDSGTQIPLVITGKV